MNSLPRRRVRRPIVPALVLIALGVIFLLTENHIIDTSVLWRLWPLVLVIAGAVRIYKHPRAAWFPSLTLIVCGLILLAATLGYLHVAPRVLWPLVLIGAGLILLWKTLTYESVASPLSSMSRENLTMFGGAEMSFSGNDFEGTQLTAVFGGYKLDLRKAIMKADKAVIDATAIFGGIELLVPTSWNVVLNASPIFGGYTDETTHPEPDRPAPQLIVSGAAVFGGVNIKN